MNSNSRQLQKPNRAFTVDDRKSLAYRQRTAPASKIKLLNIPEAGDRSPI